MNTDKRLELAKQLVDALEQEDTTKAEQLLNKMAEQTQLFKEVGKLTRQVHDTMADFSADAKIAALSEQDLPDAKARLNYVIDMTEQAAHQTLTVVENLLPAATALTEQAGQLAAKWERFLGREMPYDEFKVLSGELSQYFRMSSQTLTSTQNGLNEILLAQGFQDITGQIIRRVIELVQSLEDSMVNLIRMTGSKKMASTSYSIATGPVVPGITDQSTVVSSQDDVDDLLSSLGF